MSTDYSSLTLKGEGWVRCGQGACLVTGVEVPLFLPSRGRIHWQPGLQPCNCSPEIESSYTASPTWSPSFSGAPSYTNLAQPSLSHPFPLEIHWPPLSSSKHLGALSQGLCVERFSFLESPCINATFLELLEFFLSFLNIYFINLFIHLFLAVLGLHCCAWAFSSCKDWGLFSSCGVGASHCGGFSSCGAWALGAWASESWHVCSVGVVRELCCPVAHGIFLGQESNLCPLHWPVDF